MEPRTFQTPGEVQLQMRIPSGSVDVMLEDTPITVVEITGERDPDDFTIVLDDLASGGLRLRVEQRGRKSFGWNASRDIRVRVKAPNGAAVSLDSGAADLSVLGDAGAITMRSGSGDLNFERSDADVVAKVASGDVRGRSVGGNLRAHGASGDVNISAVEGSVVARTASGDVTLGDVRGPTDAVTASGDVSIARVHTGRVHVQSMSGDVTVGVASGTRVWMDVSSTSGTTNSDLTVSNSSDDEAATLELRLSTLSGDVRVTRSDTQRVGES